MFFKKTLREVQGPFEANGGPKSIKSKPHFLILLSNDTAATNLVLMTLACFFFAEISLLRGRIIFFRIRFKVLKRFFFLDCPRKTMPSKAPPPPGHPPKYAAGPSTRLCRAQPYCATVSGQLCHRAAPRSTVAVLLGVSQGLSGPGRAGKLRGCFLDRMQKLCPLSLLARSLASPTSPPTERF